MYGVVSTPMFPAPTHLISLNSIEPRERTPTSTAMANFGAVSGAHTCSIEVFEA